MLEVVTEPAEANEGREVGPDQQGPEEGARLRDEEVGGLAGDGQRTGRERCFAKRRSRTLIIFFLISQFENKYNLKTLLVIFLGIQNVPWSFCFF